MDSITNPYTPNAGAVPEALVGRDDQLHAFDALLQRLERGRTAQSMIITGLRGVGKTVLLARFAQIARAREWEVLEIEASKHDEQRFRLALFSQLRAALLRLSPRARWTERGKTAARILSSFIVSVDQTGTVAASWDQEALEGAGDHGDLAMDLTDVLIAIGEVAKEQERGLALLIDEVQFLDSRQFEALIQAIHKTVQRALPVTFVGAGLPQIPEMAGDAKSYAERLFTFPRIGSLQGVDAVDAFVRPAADEGVHFDGDAASLAVDITEGYPYFVQELGAQVWSVAQTGRITRDDVQVAREAYEAKLDGSFFRVRLDRASPLQTAYLRAMAELGPQPQTASDVATLLERESTQLGPTRAELINMGLLYTPAHGTAAFTVPQFDQFIRRAIPELIVPPKRSRRSSSD